MEIKEYIIDDPVWSIKGFGLSRQNMGTIGTYVTCSYRDKHKNLVFPGRYFVETKLMLRQKIVKKRGVDLYLLPFAKAKHEGEEPKKVFHVKCRLAPFIPSDEWCLESQKKAPEFCRGCLRFINI